MKKVKASFKPQTANSKRGLIIHLLSLTSPEDALTTYYTLYHQRTQLFTFGRNAVEGFLAICQTGHDLFTPLVVTRAVSDDILATLLVEYLDRGREYLFAVKWQMAPILRQYLITRDEHYNLIYTVDEASFRSETRHLVKRVVREGHYPRFEIRDGGNTVAVASTNWRSPYFAAIGVWTQEGYRGQGLAKAVVSACTSELLRKNVRPLYIVDKSNTASIRVCEALGYYFSGHKEFSCRGRLRI